MGVVLVVLVLWVFWVLWNSTFSSIFSAVGNFYFLFFVLASFYS